MAGWAWALRGPSSYTGLFTSPCGLRLAAGKEGARGRRPGVGTGHPSPSQVPGSPLPPRRRWPHQSHPTQSPTISTHALATLQGYQHRACRAAGLWPLPPISKTSSSLTFSRPPQRSQSTEATVHGGDSPWRLQSTEAAVHGCDVHGGHCPWRLQSTEASVHRGCSPRV